MPIGKTKSPIFRSSFDKKNEAGISVFELLMTTAIMFILATLGMYNLKLLNDPLHNTSQEVLGTFKLVRSKAVSTSRAYKVTPVGISGIAVSHAPDCSSSTFTSDPSLSITFPLSLSLSGPSWSICYSTQGVADGNIDFDIVAEDGDQRTLEIFQGGAARWY